MVHTAQLSVSMCVSVALSLFSGFRVEQTLLKHTGPHAHTNTINSGACLHLHFTPRHTHARSHAHVPVHTQTAFLWGTQMLKVLWVFAVFWDKCIETPFICLIYCVKSTSFTLCPQIGQTHLSSNHFLTWVSWCLHKFSDTLPTHHAWKEVSRTV